MHTFLHHHGELGERERGEYGLCGNGGTEDQLTPAPLDSFDNQIIVDVQVRRRDITGVERILPRGLRRLIDFSFFGPVVGRSKFC